MDLVRHFLLRIPSIPTQINHLSMYLQLNPSRSAEAHGKARFGWGSLLKALPPSRRPPGQRGGRVTRPLQSQGDSTGLRPLRILRQSVVCSETRPQTLMATKTPALGSSGTWPCRVRGELGQRV